MPVLIEPFFNPNVIMLKVFKHGDSLGEYKLAPGIIWPNIKETQALVAVIYADREIKSVRGPVSVNKSVIRSVVKDELEKFGRNVEMAMGSLESEVSVVLRVK